MIAGIRLSLVERHLEGKTEEEVADVCTERKAGILFGTNPDGQIDIGSSLVQRHIPLFAGRGSRGFAEQFMKSKENSNLHQKKNSFFVEKRRNILHFDKNIDIM